MKTIKYNKLIRDNIPNIICASGNSCKTIILETEQYQDKLIEKFSEELDELNAEIKSSNIIKATEELADVYQLVVSLAKSLGISLDKLEKVRASKEKSNGGFDKRLLLIEVVENE